MDEHTLVLPKCEDGKSDVAAMCLTRAVRWLVEGTNYTVCSHKVVDSVDQYYVSSNGRQQTDRQTVSVNH